ncbi:hypothetical protein BDZ85DRAFT_261964 [Elsinoe ampelina]|uniref:Uncharacterized protein n=1 Tax=Elsinoe ampelina TaxID=302913 RepID=A0A6A6GD74_9PEZI|nr:hypothetical protein BDZ85DRAFT_261964 [Elsinoe ampelina]
MMKVLVSILLFGSLDRPKLFLRERLIGFIHNQAGQVLWELGGEVQYATASTEATQIISRAFENPSRLTRSSCTYFLAS